VFTNFFSEGRDVCEMMGRDMAEPDRPQTTIQHGTSVCVLPNQGYKHTLTICNTSCFSTTKMVCTKAPQYILPFMFRVPLISCWYSVIVYRSDANLITARPPFTVAVQEILTEQIKFTT